MIIPHSRPLIDQEDIKAVADVLHSGQIAQGEKVEQFENAIARFVGTKFGVAVSSGTAALHLALLALGVGAGDEVIVPSYVCSSPYFATSHAGATAKFVDIDLSDMNISTAEVRKHVSSRTKAIVVPHMFGTPAELDDLQDFGIPIIEDCAQSLGALYKKRLVGSFGDLSVFSFYATKMITTGEGGMVLTNSRELHQKIADVRDYDRKPLIPIRFNYKMTDVQAALGLSQLKKLPRFIERRRGIASTYNERFSKYNVVVPSEHSHKKSVFFRYVIKVKKRKNIETKAKKNGVMCEKPVFLPLHKNFKSAKCPNSDDAHSHALSIPIYPNLSEQEIAYLLEKLEFIFEN